MTYELPFVYYDDGRMSKIVITAEIIPTLG